jgi:hypothetical protein|tara:strand:- start:1526 stop:2080 length:555 start_codon:yes stop_codon:yes gene_type:complete
MTTTVRTLVLAACTLAVLGGCSDTRRALGIDKSLPDEFAVVRRAPLVMPPDYNLRPPAPGSERPQEGTTAEQARNTLIGRNRIDGYRVRGFSAGEIELLDSAGADFILPGIRVTLDRETSAFATESDSFTDRLVFWSSNRQLGTPIDPVAEQKRLNQNQALGKDPTDGPIPVISKGGSSVLGIF